MTKIAPITLLLMGTILFAPLAPALAFSNEEASTEDGGAQIADPDEAIDQFANPDAGTAGEATEVPPIVMTGDGSNDYLSPDADDDSVAGASPEQGTAN